MTQDLKDQCFIPKNIARNVLSLPLRVDIREDLEKALAQDLSGMRLVAVTSTQLNDALEVFNLMIQYGERQMECRFEDLLYNFPLKEAKQTIRRLLTTVPLPAAPKTEEK